MAKITMKFGGTSVADLDRICHVASLVKREIDRGNQVAVVVSAMAGETNKLVGWTRELSPLHDAREYDVVVAAGEQITAGLLAVALGAIGVSARSWMGWQIPINTSAMHGSARIESIEPTLMNERLAQGQVAVVAGFQGIAPDHRISTLGRGGSDTSAVAVAAAIKADRCDIYTDVDGVYTTDPRIVAKARRLEKIAFEEMLEMASLGAKVLQTRSVEIAMLHRVPVRVLSTFDPEAGGTLLCDEEDIVEKKPVTGIAYSRDEAKITLHKIPDRPGIAAAIFGPLADAGVNVDMIVQNVSRRRQQDRSHLHRLAQRAGPRAVGARAGGASHRLSRSDPRRQRRQDLHHRHRHARPSGRGPDHVPDAVGQGDQYPGDLDLGDKGERPDRGRICRAGGAGASFSLRAGCGLTR